MQATKVVEQIIIEDAHRGTDLSSKRKHFQSLSINEVKTLPPIKWLISDILPENALSMIYGYPGIGKSFLLLDWALCIATGRQWCGCSCEKGYVYYIAGEGFGGMGKRIKAWERSNGLEVNEGVNVLGGSMSIQEKDALDELCKDISELPAKPILIVIDTLARCMLKGDENNGKDIGEFIDAADKLRSIYGSHVAIVHHKPKKGIGARGHSALSAAVDTIIEVVKEKDTVILKCEKQKDGQQFENICLTLAQVDLDEEAQGSEKQTSCVLNPTGETYSASQANRPLTRNELRAIDALKALGGEASYNDWHVKSTLSGSSFDKARENLQRKGYIDRHESRNWFVVQRDP